MILRQQIHMVQAVAFADERVPPDMVKFICDMPLESVVEVAGTARKLNQTLDANHFLKSKFLSSS